MRNSEKGFTYPLTLCLLILFLFFFSMRVDQLLSKRMIARETSVILQEEYYYLSSVKKIENLLQSSGSIPAKGVIPYWNGTMTYEANAPIGYSQKVQFSLQMKTGETVTGYGTFDTRSKKLIKWQEL